MNCTELKRRSLQLGVALLLGLASLAGVAQEKYPSRPVEFIVPWGPGGGADQVARESGKIMEGILKTSFPVVNVPGATGNAGMAKLLAAPADGYSISVMTWDTYALLATTKTRWSMKDIVPVALMIKQPSAFMSATNSTLKTWADVEREAKVRPLKVAITGFGSPDDITVNYFIGRGLKLIAVPFAKPGERYTSVLGGHADLLYEQLGDVRSFIDSKQIRPLIIFSATRFSVFPDVPASKELGYDITLPQRRAVIVKAGTDAGKIKVLSDALAKVAVSAEYQAYLKQQYAADDSYFAAQDAAKVMEEDLDQMRRISAQTATKK